MLTDRRMSNSMAFRLNLTASIPTRLVLAVVICFVSILLSGFVFYQGNNSFRAQNQYHATKSTYFKRPKFSSHEPLKWIPENIPENLTVVYVDALFRHGTRYPSKDKISKWKIMLLTLHNIKKSNHPLLKNVIQDWDKYMPSYRSYTLHNKGWNEMSYLARHYYRMCKNSIFKPYRKNIPKNNEQETGQFSRSDYLDVVTSDKVRVKASARAFLESISCLVHNSNEDESNYHVCQEDYKEIKVLEKGNTVINGHLTYGGIKVLVDSQQMRPFDSCSRYKNLELSRTQSENMYYQTPLYQSLVQNITQLLGVEHLEEIEVYHLYQICTFMYAMYDQTSVCDLFSKQQMEIFEYASDLKHYYKTGYGYNVNAEMFCPLMHNIVQRLDSVVAQFKHDKTILKSSMLRFGHAETLIPLLSLLGLFKDDIPLRLDNFLLHKKRNFRTGTFSPFAGNVGFILYHNTTTSQLALVVVVNEYMVKIRNEDSYFVDYIKVRSILLSRIHKINCDSVCYT